MAWKAGGWRMLVLFLAVASPAGAGQFVVVESTSPKLPAGAVVESGQPLPLGDGERASLVRDDGSVVRLAGPAATVPVAPDASPAERGVVPALARLFAADQPSASAWGTFRGNEARNGREAANPPSVWAVNVFRSGSVCVPTGIAPTLWRSDDGPEQVLILLHLSTGREAEVEFPLGEHTAPWPAAVPVLDGGEYAVRDAGNSWERRLAIQVIPAEQTDSVRRVAWMSDAGCLRQAQLLLVAIR